MCWWNSGIEKNVIKSNNKKAIEENSPYDYVLEGENDRARIYSFTKLRGEVGESITKNSKVLENDVNRAIFVKCNFAVTDLIETRVVSHKLPVFDEVWVYKDDKSQMKDKTSALGVRLVQLPENGGVDIYIAGECNKSETKFYFDK